GARNVARGGELRPRIEDAFTGYIWRHSQFSQFGSPQELFRLPGCWDGAPPLQRFQDGFEQLAGVRLLENLADPRGGVGSLGRAGIGLEPVGGCDLGDVPELRDEHGEVSA